MPMTSKEFLTRYMETDKQINRLLCKADEALLRAMSISPVYGSGGHGSGVSDKVGLNLAEYDYYIKQADELTDKLYQIKREIISVLKLMPDARYRTVLYLRYIKLLPWDKIAYRLIKTQDMVFNKERTTRYIENVRKNMHGQALLSFDKVLSVKK